MSTVTRDIPLNEKLVKIEISKKEVSKNTVSRYRDCIFHIF